MHSNRNTHRNSSSVRFKSIDMLRGLAALTVVFSHYFPFWSRYEGEVLVIVPGKFGYYAVNLFFVISGLVIFKTLEKCSSVFDFALLRFSRLYPVYWTTLFIATFVNVVVFGNYFWAGGFIVNISMFQEFLRYPNFDNVYWSLTVELAFYLNVAWVFALGMHKRARQCIAVWLFVSAIWAVSIFQPEADTRDWLALLFALDYAPFFAIGILTYVNIGKRWQPWDLALLAASLAVEFLIASWEGLAVAVISAILVVAGVSGRLNFANTRVFLWLGTISYSLYLIHRNIAYNVLPWLHDQGFGPIPAISITTAGILALASLVTYFVEIPASRYIRANFHKQGRQSG